MISELKIYLEKIMPGNEWPLEATAEAKFGDYSSNAAFFIAKESLRQAQGIKPKSPLQTAKELTQKIKEADKGMFFVKVEAAAPGFINFWLKPEVFQKELAAVLKNKDKYGRNNNLNGQKTIIEYTDPNPFKEFHIGHLMSNAIGEALSRLIEWNGAKVKRVCYQGDVGLHVAKTIWGILRDKNNFPKDSAPLSEKISFLGRAYVFGSQKYEADAKIADEIKEINKKIFAKSDEKINSIYEKGRKWSMAHFDEIYARLGTKFDYLISESSVIDDGEKIVAEFLDKGVFEKSEGAIVFKGEKFGLHTRVFINSQGLPTYETKELGLAKKKIEIQKNADLSLTITANEQNDYFKVVYKALEFIFPEYAKIAKHIGHGMLRFAEGKMSSRTGNVITAEALIADVEKMVADKIKDRNFSEKQKLEIEDAVAIGALKYSILKQAIGGDIIFDFGKSISFEGDSGPYLQYAYTRANSVLEKAKEEKVKASFKLPMAEVSEIEKMICRFPEVVERAGKEYAPNYLTTYLTELARAFNAYYAKVQIVDSSDKYSPYKVVLTSAFAQVMVNGLEILGIGRLDKM